MLKPVIPLERVAEVIGADAMGHLTANFAGRLLYIRKTPTGYGIDGHAEYLLAHHFGGERIYIPAPKLREEISKLLARGWSVSQVAAELGCTERYVYQVAQKETS